MAKKETIFDDENSESDGSDTETFFTNDENEITSTSNKSSSSESNDKSEHTDNKPITFIKLRDNGKTEIRYVYHISDIHIRNTQRHIEYKEVFERTYKKLKTEIGSDKKISLIVLTGDIMHTKTELSPEAFYIAHHFFKALNEIAPVILIPGNHDCNLSNRNRLDALSPIVENTGNLENLYYLKKSGIYQYYNLIFGVTTVFDDILIPASKISTEIWKNVKQKNKFKISMFHGPVHSAQTDVGYRMNNEELLVEDFEGYDFVFLGDIHKYQYMDKEKTIAYSGSLIQQSYGESLDNHGILKWDLFEKNSTLLDIKNDYGYCTIRIVDGKMINTKIPRKPRIRFILENTNELQYQDVCKSLEKEYQIHEIIKESNFKTKMHNRSPGQKKFKEEVTAYATQEIFIKDHLAKKGLEKDKINLIIDLHKKIYQKILAEKKDQVADTMHNATKNQKWKLLQLKFSNMLSYGKDNIIDFRNYGPNKIIGIVAPNHYGKSAILDIILFCLFDKFSRGDRKDILNKNEKSMYCSLLLSVGSQLYLIERIGKRSKNNLSVKIDVNFYLIKKDKKNKEIKEKLNDINVTKTNDKIKELIGNYEDYLTTCFCLQNKNTNFIDMTQQNKKEYLNEILKLNVFEDCHELAKEKLKKLTIQLKMMEQNVGNISFEKIKENMKKNNLEIKRLEKQRECINIFLAEELQHIVQNLEQSQLRIYDELSEYDLKTEENILNTIQTIKEKLEQKINDNLEEVNKELKSLKEKLHKMEEEQTIYLDNSNVDELLNKKEKLIKKLHKIPNDFNNENVVKFIKEKNDTLEKMQSIDKILQDYKNKHLSDKMDRIDELKKIIVDLRAELKPINGNGFEQLALLQNNLVENQKVIISSLDDISRPSKNLTDEQKERLKDMIKIKSIFSEHIKHNSSQLKEYIEGFSDKNDKLINQLQIYNQEWLNDYNLWLENSKKILERNGQKEVNISDLFKKSKNMSKEMVLAGIDFFDDHDNNIIRKKIKKAEAELDSLSEFKGTKKEIENLKQEKKLLQEKIILLEDKINEHEDIKKNLESNNDIQTEIDALQTEIDKENIKAKQMTNIIKELKVKIGKNEDIINKYKNQLKEHKKLKQHFKLLNEYHMRYLMWNQKNDFLKKWTSIKKQFDNDLNNINNEIEKRKIDEATYKKNIEDYLKNRKAFDNKSDKTNLYKSYVETMNYNGLPYEMLKRYLPMIESDVNQTLHSMVNFSIQFMFYDEDQLEEQKSKNLKSNKGCVDVNICYQDGKPYNVKLSSGFERFIIGLAIRMTLCQISLTAKPNFLIIDEGWSCLDSENLNNVGTIMNYIKTQYEHIIIISHLEELKNQADYVINIEKDNGYSYIKTINKLIIKRKKNNNSKKIINV